MALAEIVQRAIEVLPVLARFAVMMALIVMVPRLSRRVRLPEAAGLLLSGVVLGPHMGEAGFSETSMRVGAAWCSSRSVRGCAPGVGL